MANTITYSKLIEKIAPLDLILFKGGDLVSDTIRFLEKEELKNGDFSHCGLIVNSELLPTVPQLIPGKWYVWESTMSATSGLMSHFSDNVPNVETGKGKFGVQIRDFEDVIPSYLKTKGTAIAWCQLKDNPWKQKPDENILTYYWRKKKLIKKACNTHKRYGNRMYDVNFLSLFAALFPCLRKARDEFNEIFIDGHKILSSIDINIDPAGWLFCSELVALVYQRLGIIGKQFNPADVVPVDFLGYDKDGLPKLVYDPVYITDLLSHLMFAGRP